MKKYKLQNIIYVLCLLSIIASCQPSIRFASNANKPAKESTSTVRNSDFIRSQKEISKTQSKRLELDTQKSSHPVVVIAETWLGVSYKYGGNDKNGIDCSGFVKNVFKEIGVNLPRTSAEQFIATLPVNNPEVGDLIFFKKNGRVYHVGICVGENLMIHASSSSGVMRQVFTEGIYAKNYAGAGRISSR